MALHIVLLLCFRVNMHQNTLLELRFALQHTTIKEIRIFSSILSSERELTLKYFFINQQNKHMNMKSLFFGPFLIQKSSNFLLLTFFLIVYYKFQ